jgi:two-component system sensor histidine kinase/response regulator
VESQPGQGSVFRFTARVTIPKRAADQTTTHITGLSPGQPAYRLLVADDNEDNRNLLLTLLNDLGFATQGAVNGREAVEKFQAWKPHLIFMDMRMPEVDGSRAASEIRSSPGGEDPVIIALTASAFDDERNDILAAGCDDFIRKPYKTELIYNTLRKHLKLRFTYEEKGKDPSSSPDEKPDLAILVGALPKELSTRMLNAAVRADVEASEKILEEIRSLNQHLAFELEKLINEFEFERIQVLFNKEAP